MLNRLPQAESSRVGQIHNEAAAKTPDTGGQPPNLETDVGRGKEDKGSDKHARRKSKVTFAQLLEKYQRISEAKSAHQPINAKTSKSPPGRNSENRDWRKEKLNVPNQRTPFGSPMPKSSKSLPGRNSENRDWRKEKLGVPNQRTPFGPPMPKSSMPSRVSFHSYP